MVLEGDQRLDGVGETGPQRLGEKLQQVAQAFAFDAQSVDSLDGRPLQHRLVGPQLAVVVPDLGGQNVADQMGMGRVIRGGLHADAVAMRGTRRSAVVKSR